MIVIDDLSGKIICADEEKGAVHDFEIFKQSGIRDTARVLGVSADKVMDSLKKQQI